MATRKEQNKYYPPEWTPDMGSLNRAQGVHPLRARARKLESEGVLVIRFEMPFNVWCTGCERQIAKATRFNADKVQAGMYHTTPIWEFRMKCPACANVMVIQTDPRSEGEGYAMVSGVRRRNEVWKPGPDDGFGVLSEKRYDEGHRERLRTDPLYRLEHARADALSAESGLSQLERIGKLVEQERDVYSLNQNIRKRLREQRRQVMERQHQLEEQKTKLGFGLPLLLSEQLTSSDELKLEKTLLEAATTAVESRETKEDSRTAATETQEKGSQDAPQHTVKRVNLMPLLRIVPRSGKTSDGRVSPRKRESGEATTLDLQEKSESRAADESGSMAPQQKSVRVNNLAQALAGYSDTSESSDG